MPFTNRVHLSDAVLDEVNEFKDLGILTDNGLSWNSHIDMITAEANKMLGLITRTCMDLKDESTLKTLYCSLVRSDLEYCSVVWCPFTKRNVNKLERIQRRATRFILKSSPSKQTQSVNSSKDVSLLMLPFCLRLSVAI